MKTNSDNSEIIGLCHVGIHDPEGNMAEVYWRTELERPENELLVR
jgi:hypothetical protein